MSNLEKPIKLEAEVQWAFFNKKSEMSGKFQVDLCNLSKEAVSALEQVGLNPRQRPDKPEKGWFLTAKSNYEIVPFDKAGKEIKEAVGNGSKCTALIKPYEWKWQAKKGVSPSLVKITITDLVVYNADGAAEEELDDEIAL
jgi:hypothetical protein